MIITFFLKTQKEIGKFTVFFFISHIQSYTEKGKLLFYAKQQVIKRGGSQKNCFFPIYLRLDILGRRRL